ncbi:hypothetical protein E4U53_007782 [Claviceps sorghi]|nr:hypothetical protein E4U53_007782 [Claviceps sorghi]
MATATASEEAHSRHARPLRGGDTTPQRVALWLNALFGQTSSETDFYWLLRWRVHVVPVVLVMGEQPVHRAAV